MSFLRTSPHRNALRQGASVRAAGHSVSLCAALLCLSAFCSERTMLGQAAVAPDTEFWDEIDLAARLSTKFTLTLPLVLRNSVTLPDPQLYGVGPLLDFAALKHVTLTAGYLFVGLPRTGAGYRVHVPLAAVTLHAGYRRLLLSDRSRAEGLIGIPQDPIRYRNKLVLDLPLADGRWQPFLSNEAIYDFAKSAWTQNRFQAGVGRQMGPRLRLDVFYLERNARRSNPPATHAIGTTLSIRFTRTSHHEGQPHEQN